MKVFYSILAIYMMTVFLMPCTDMYEKDNFQNHNHSEELTHQGSHDHQETTDMCSPFCYCNCCSISIATYHFKPFEIKQPKPTLVVKKITLRDFTLISFYSGSIWHPPKFTV